ncbi:hypothetical protein [Paraburkholderia sp. 2C]
MACFDEFVTADFAALKESKKPIPDKIFSGLADGGQCMPTEPDNRGYDKIVRIDNVTVAGKTRKIAYVSSTFALEEGKPAVTTYWYVPADKIKK